MADANQQSQPQGSVKETLISIVISLAMALVAKAYVVEAFVIPTGSMAPTLLGQHMLFESDQTGNEWAVNYWFPPGSGTPSRVQAARSRSGGLLIPEVTDPMTTSQINRPGPDAAGYRVRGDDDQPNLAPRLRFGDRILVQKLLYELFGPERYDVIVFKNPTQPKENFIKRLVGLPDEAILIVDGDVFAAPAGPDGGVPEWDDFEVATKPRRVQQDLWRPVFSSEFAPLEPVLTATGRRIFTAPWYGESWDTTGRVYSTESSVPTELSWDTEGWPITDWNPYNENATVYMLRGQLGPLDPNDYYPVSDLRLRAGVEAGAEGLAVAATITARGHVFEALMGDGVATLRMRAVDADEWRVLASGTMTRFAPGRVVPVEFWHVDQRLALYVDDELITEGAYDWNPDERYLHVLGRRAADVGAASVVGRPGSYAAARPSVSWRFDGAPVTLHRVGLDKDIYYRADSKTRRATHPSDVVVLGDDQYFVLGDNSAASADSRAWQTVDEQVAKLDPTKGVVNKKLVLGKAFFVYFPAPHGFGRIPVPDFGRMRAIN